MFQQRVHFRVRLLGVADLGAGVHDGGVVASAQVSADFFEAVLGEVAGQIHADLTRLGDALAPPLTLEIRQTDVEVMGDGVDDVGDADVAGCYPNLPLERFLGHRQRHGFLFG